MAGQLLGEVRLVGLASGSCSYHSVSKEDSWRAVRLHSGREKEGVGKWYLIDGLWLYDGLSNLPLHSASCRMSSKGQNSRKPNLNQFRQRAAEERQKKFRRYEHTSPTSFSDEGIAKRRQAYVRGLVKERKQLKRYQKRVRYMVSMGFVVGFPLMVVFGILVALTDYSFVPLMVGFMGGLSLAFLVSSAILLRQ